MFTQVRDDGFPDKCNSREVGDKYMFKIIVFLQLAVLVVE